MPQIQRHYDIFQQSLHIMKTISNENQKNLVKDSFKKTNPQAKTLKQFIIGGVC